MELWPIKQLSLAKLVRLESRFKTQTIFIQEISPYALTSQSEAFERSSSGIDKTASSSPDTFHGILT